MPDAPLAGSKVGIECGQGDSDSRVWHPALFDGCRDLAKMVKLMGAKVSATEGLLPPVVDAEGVEVEQLDTGKEPADFTVRYVDRDHDRDYCGWTLPLFILTFSLFPCVEDLTTQAEIQLVAADGAVDRLYPLQLDVTRIYGPLALYYLSLRAFSWPESNAERRRHQQRALTQYAADVIYSYRLKTQLTAAEVKP